MPPKARRNPAHRARGLTPGNRRAWLLVYSRDGEQLPSPMIMNFIRQRMVPTDARKVRSRFIRTIRVAMSRRRVQNHSGQSQTQGGLGIVGLANDNQIAAAAQCQAHGRHEGGSQHEAPFL